MRGAGYGPQCLGRSEQDARQECNIVEHAMLRIGSGGTHVAEAYDFVAQVEASGARGEGPLKKSINPHPHAMRLPHHALLHLICLHWPQSPFDFHASGSSHQ